MKTHTHEETVSDGRSDGTEQLLLDALRSNLDLLGELTMRYQVETKPERPEDPPTIVEPRDVNRILGPEMSALAQEQLRVLLLDTKNNVVGQRVIYQGTVNSAWVRPAELLRPAVVAAVPKIVMVHNHPSGNPEPSPEDLETTGKVFEAAELLGIELMDHVVIGEHRYVSLAERGRLSNKRTR